MVHDAAATGFQRESSTYASARPSYHPEIVDEVVRRTGLGPVVDLGAGTGIATAALIARGVEVIAIEPVVAMRARLQADLADVTAIEGTAESIPLPDAAAQAVVVAQAFHWFDHAVALAEIARVLAPTGLLVTLWNVKDETVPWMAAYTHIQDRVQGDTPRYRDMIWRAAIERDTRFRFDGEVRTPNPQPSDPDRTAARLLSTSFIARLDRARQHELELEIRALVADLGDTYDFPYFTEAQFWRLVHEPV